VANASPTVCIVGVGLLGGSLALALKQRRLVGRVVGTDRLPGLLSRALERGLVDEAEPDLTKAVASADVVVFCTPVDVIAAQAVEASAHCKPGTLLTDVGSTKSAIVAAVEGRMPPGVDFVGAHPLAGSEKSGPEYAQIDLFEGRLVVLTPSATTTPAALNRARAFWLDLGARVEVLGAAEHDHALALTSHLPHLVASVLSGILPGEWRGLTATGFRDTTRLAGGSPEMWKAIFLNNRDSVLQAVDLFRVHLAQFRTAIAAGDARALERLLDDAKRIRDGLPGR
jgi:cyclohexadieny/prephenate dehydrogenase